MCWLWRLSPLQVWGLHRSQKRHQSRRLSVSTTPISSACGAGAAGDGILRHGATASRTTGMAAAITDHTGPAVITIRIGTAVITIPIGGDMDGGTAGDTDTVAAVE